MIRIGCDPEFIVVKNNSFVPAYRIFPEDSCCGLDGDQDLAEIRPLPAPNSFVLIANIKKLFKEVLEKMPFLKDNKISFLAGHFKFAPLGGHIHLSSPFLRKSTYDELYEKLNSTHLVLSDLIDPLQEREMRKNAGYGYGWRVADHGGMEYRTPGSWLLSPLTAFANLYLAETTTREFILKNYQIFDKFENDRVIDKMKAIINFIENLNIEKEIKQAALKIFDKLFNLIPLNWNEDIKGGWL